MWHQLKKSTVANTELVKKKTKDVKEFKIFGPRGNEWKQKEDWTPCNNNEILLREEKCDWIIGISQWSYDLGKKKKKRFFVPIAKFRDRVTISKHIFPKHYSYFRSNSLSWTCCLLTVHRIQVCGYSMPSFGLVLSVFSFHVEISL